MYVKYTYIYIWLLIHRQYGLLLTFIFHAKTLAANSVTRIKPATINLFLLLPKMHHLHWSSRRCCCSSRCCSSTLLWSPRISISVISYCPDCIVHRLHYTWSLIDIKPVTLQFIFYRHIKKSVTVCRPPWESRFYLSPPMTLTPSSSPVSWGSAHRQRYQGQSQPLSPELAAPLTSPWKPANKEKERETCVCVCVRKRETKTERNVFAGHKYIVAHQHTTCDWLKLARTPTWLQQHNHTEWL